MTKRRITVTIDEDVYETAVKAVESGRAPSVSAWVNDTLSDRQEKERRLNAAAEAVRFYEQESGRVITEEDMAEAEQPTPASRLRPSGPDGRPAGGPDERHLRHRCARRPRTGRPQAVEHLQRGDDVGGPGRHPRRGDRPGLAGRSRSAGDAGSGARATSWSSRSTTSSGGAAGILLARAGTSDAIDAAVVALAEDGDRILTSDPDDIDRLVEAAGLDVEVVAV